LVAILKGLSVLCRVLANNNHIDTGNQGEALAAQYLAEKGYRIVERNYRAGRGEIDIIAWLGDKLLVFVEVKTRAYEAFGGPEAAVSLAKQRVLLRTAGAYMESIGYEWAIRFDVIAVLLPEAGAPVIRHHEDAFFV
jgi:putative endonuclease